MAIRNCKIRPKITISAVNQEFSTTDFKLPATVKRVIGARLHSTNPKRMEYGGLVTLRISGIEVDVEARAKSYAIHTANTFFTDLKEKSKDCKGFEAGDLTVEFKFKDNYPPSYSEATFGTGYDVELLLQVEED